MRLAVLADIHGNVLALEAVLADLARRGGADLTVDLGDCVSGPLWPRETMDLLDRLKLPTVCGNHDRWVASRPRDRMGASDAFAHDELSEAQRRRLGLLPGELRPLADVLMFHATPDNDTHYLLDRVEAGGLRRDDRASIRDKLAGRSARLILCGHSHRPDLVQLDADTLILNPGSVGCPGYDDDTPPAHVSESGAPFARYALVDIDGPRLGVDLLAVPYDHETAAHRAEANGRPEWAYALRHGFMPTG